MASGRHLLAAALTAALGCTAPEPGLHVPPSPVPPGPLACAGDVASFASDLLLGFAGSDATAKVPGFGLRYLYIAGVLAPDAGCYDLARPNAVGCGSAWWGTWQYDQLPPGQYPADFADRAGSDGQIPMVTYYVILPAAREALGVAEGMPEATVAARDVPFMARYLADYRFLLQRLGSRTAIVHVEPDFWGYAQHAAIQAGTGAGGLAAAVASANPTDCGGYPDTIAGLGACMVHMARVHAPNALVGLHASGWASGFDCIQNANPSLDVAAEAGKTAAFLAAAGAAAGDLVVADLADRDAGWRAAQGQDTWLDATDATLPSYAQALGWTRAIADGLGKPVVLWQLPVGNTGLPDLDHAWKDNKVEYLLAHTDRVAAAGAVGLAFGAGDAAQTTPETDGGFLAAAAAALEAAGGQPLCP